jgi:uncharacterized protein YxjI
MAGQRVMAGQQRGEPPDRRRIAGARGRAAPAAGPGCRAPCRPDGHWDRPAITGLLHETNRGDALFRGRREERREEREATRYQMRQRMISIGDDYVIENDRGERVFKLDGKALRIRKTIRFEDMDGHELAKIQERMLHIKDSMEIEGPDGNRMALVKKAMITPLRERWIAKVEDGPDLHTHGNIVDHEYSIERDGDKVAEVSKRWFRVRDTYGVEVFPGEDDVLILAIVAVIDTMAHPDR